MASSGLKSSGDSKSKTEKYSNERRLYTLMVMAAAATVFPEALSERHKTQPHGRMEARTEEWASECATTTAVEPLIYGRL